MLGCAFGLVRFGIEAAWPFLELEDDASSDLEVVAAALDGEAAAALLRFFDFLEGDEPDDVAGLAAASAGARKSKRPSGSILKSCR